MSADGTIPEALTSASTSSWYTPAAIVEAARLALGGTIDIDPASCATANATVQARGFYGEAQDGLSRVWHGAVFCNPPSPPRPWWRHLRGCIVAGNVGRAIFVGYSIETLQQFQDDREWFDHWHWCIPAKRVKYDTPAVDRVSVMTKRHTKLIHEHAKVHGVGTLSQDKEAQLVARILKTERERNRLAAMAPDAHVRGDAPAHASVVFGYDMSLDTFKSAFDAVGASR